MTDLNWDSYQPTVEFIAESIINGEVVPFLGAGVNLADRPRGYRWDATSRDFLPSGGELAEYLAKVVRYFHDRDCIATACLNHADRCPSNECPMRAPRSTCDPEHCRMKAATLDLARVTQFMTMARNSDEAALYGRLRSVFERSFEPTTAHRYFASLFHDLNLRGLTKRQPLIVTTNYDDLMERAFERVGQPVDVVFYEAKRGPSRGRFFHRKAGERSATRIVKTSPYPFLEDHPVILKIHGQVDPEDSAADSYVVTEDNYIEYLTGTGIDQILPSPLLKPLRRLRLLFLGYALRDWNLRVFLRRLATKQSHRRRHWAVALGFSAAEREVWREQDEFPIDVLDVPIAAFIDRLRQSVEGQLAASGNV
jgi:hypothetical protein